MKILFGFNVMLFFFICSVFGIGWLWSISEKKRIENLNDMKRWYLKKSSRAFILKQSYYNSSRRKKHMEYISRLLYEADKREMYLCMVYIREDMFFFLKKSSYRYLQELLFDLKENNYQEFIKSENQGEDVC